MSVVFTQRGIRPPPNTQQIQKMLDENTHLIQTIHEFQSKGQINECVQYQQVLHRNLVYLASMADATQNIQAILPPPHQLQNATPQPNQNLSHGASPDNPANQQGGNPAYSQATQNYRGSPNVTVPSSPRPSGAPQPYAQRGYPQNQYQGQYQNMTNAPYPAQNQSGYLNPNQQSYAPQGSQPQTYPNNSSYGPPITTAQNSNYQNSGHQNSNYPASTMQQPYVPPPPAGPMPNNPIPYSGTRGTSSQNYSTASGFQGPPMASTYGTPTSNASQPNYNNTSNQNYQAQQYAAAPPSGYPSTATSQPNHSPQPVSAYTNQTSGSSYGPPSAQSPTYSSPNSHNSNPQNGNTQPSNTNLSSQSYPPPSQPPNYPPSSQPPFSNPSSQPGSPAPSNYQSPVTQSSNNPTSSASQGYAPPAPQPYPPPGGSYPPHGYGNHPQSGYPPSQYANASYQYSRPPAPQPPPQGAYGGYNYQPNPPQ